MKRLFVSVSILIGIIIPKDGLAKYKEYLK